MIPQQDKTHYQLYPLQKEKEELNIHRRVFLVRRGVAGRFEMIR